MKWYTIKVQNNKERKVAQRMKIEMLRDFNEELNIIIPTNAIVSINKDGKNKTKEKLLCPGYIFVGTDNVEKIQHLIKQTDGATTILKDSNGNPVPLRDDEVRRMLDQKESVDNIINDSFKVGDKVRILEGPFKTFSGTVDYVDHNKIRVNVSIFSRDTTIEITSGDLIKIND